MRMNWDTGWVRELSMGHEAMAITVVAMTVTVLLYAGCMEKGSGEPKPTARGTTVVGKASAQPVTRPTPHPPREPREFGREVRQLFSTMFCVGRRDDWPCKLLSHEVRRIRNQYTISVNRWFQQRRPASAPRTVLYPFSGGDLATVMAAYGSGQRFFHLSLEHGGPPDPLARMKPRNRHKARLVFVQVARDLANYSFNFSEVLQAQEKAGVPGVLPLLLTGLRIHRGRPTGLRYFRLTPTGKIRYLTNRSFAQRRRLALRHSKEWPVPRMDARFANLELRFRLPGDGADRVIRHVSANLSNKSLARRPSLVAYLRSLGEHSLMIKANSWLLRSDAFSDMRNLVFRKARFFAADTVDAPPPSWLKKRGFRIWVYGKFECFLSAPHLAEVWRLEFLEQENRKLPFRFGYQDCKERNSLVLGSRIRSSSSSSSSSSR